MNQVQMELQFSKKMSDFIISDSFMNDAGSIMSAMHKRVSEWREGEFFGEREQFVNYLPETEEIVMSLMLTIMSKFNQKEYQIQGLAVELGSRLGFNNTLDAVKIGSSIIGLCAEDTGDLYDMKISNDGTYILPRFCIDVDARDKIGMLSYLPPNLVPAVWQPTELSGNYGGWQWEKKSVILGAGNHHICTQSMDVLNILQQMEWEIDTETLVNFDNPNMTYGEEEILGHYSGEKFYFTWRFDKRGRMYSSGYQINPQSSEYGKAMLSPTRKEVCSQDGIIELEKYMINMYGDNKLILADKAFKSLQKAILHEPVNAMVELDATCSGYQIMACLSGCVKTGILCNLTAEPKQDLYTHVLHKLEKRVGDLGFERKDVKKAIMTAVYNSKAKPKEIFGKHVDAFWNVLYTECPGAMEVMDIINTCWNPYAFEHSWIMPDGHVCMIKVMEKKSVRVSLPETESTFTFIYNNNQPSDNSRSLVPNIIHSIDAYVCREMIRDCHEIDIQISCIHDCWQCHPNNVSYVKYAYRKILHNLTTQNLLNDICSQIIGRDAGIKINNEGLGSMIASSDFALDY